VLASRARARQGYSEAVRVLEVLDASDKGGYRALGEDWPDYRI